MAVTNSEVEQMQQRVLRQVSSIAAVFAANNINNGTWTLEYYISTLVNQASSRTQPALIVPSYFEGLVPASARLTNLAIAAQAQYDYYGSTGANAAMGPYEAFGLAFSDEPSWNLKYAGKSLTDVIQETYFNAMGVLPSSAQVTHFTSQHTSFKSQFTGVGQSAADADRHARGAVVGQILYYGATTAGTSMYTKSRAWLTSAGYGTESYGVPL